MIGADCSLNKGGTIALIDSWCWILPRLMASKPLLEKKGGRVYFSVHFHVSSLT